MKLTKSEKTAANTCVLEFTIEPEVVKDAVSTVFRRDARKYNVPGFRKGKAPRNLIEKMYGADVFLYDAVNEAFPDAYKAALAEAGFEAVGQPQADLVSVSAADGAVLKVTVVVKPEIKIGKYKGLKAVRTVSKADEARVDDEIDRMRQRNARMITREGAAENGDIANVDYEGFVDGVPFDGGKDTGHSLTLGSHQFIEGFEEQIVGHKAGDAFEVNVTFPKEYHAENLAGKAAVFQVKVNEVQQRELPELDDEFAKDVSEYDTLTDLKDSIRDGLQKELDEAAAREVENALVGQIVDTIEGEIPQEMYDNRVDEMVRDFSFRLEQQRMNLTTYMQYSGMDEATFRDGFRENAEKQVKMRLALEAVVSMEGIEATEEDIEAEVNRIAEKYEMEKEQVKNLMPIEEIAKDLAVNKAIDLVKSEAVVTEEEAKKADEKEEEKGAAPPKAPAKKAAEKKPVKKTEKAPKEE